MQSRINLLILVCLAALTFVGFVQRAVGAPKNPDSTSDANQAPVLSFPYVAQITGDNVYIRSGPGTNYYRCGKLHKTDKVKVISAKHSWSRIVAPAGSFSWISKQYVSIDKDSPSTGVVTGDAVRVYAGSEYLKPIHSTIWHFKLNKGDKVKLTGEEAGDYYKIVPPTGAYLWVSTEYTKPLESVSLVSPTIESVQEPQTPGKADVIAGIPTDARPLEKYYALKDLIEAERAKPITQQDYTNLRKILAEIAANKEDRKAARYAEFTIGQIKRFELALQVDNELKLQDKQLQQIKKRIDKACTAKLAEIPDVGKFAVIGQLQTSSIYYAPKTEPKCYRILDDYKKTICYAIPTGPAANMDLSKFVGVKVGLIGTIESHRQTAGALVRFSEIGRVK